MNGFTNYTVHNMLTEIKEECWVSLHFDDPNLAGAYASEITGGAYVREKAKFGDIGNRTMWLADDLKFNGLSLNRVTHLGGWNLQYKGDLLWACELNPPVRILEGKGFSVGKDDLALSFG